MAPAEHVYKALEDMGISYEVVEHPPALTTEEADKYIEGKEGCRTKTLFLRNRNKKRCILLIMDEVKRLDMKKCAEILEEKEFKFASAELLAEKLGLAAGVVSPFGLLNNTARDVTVYFDKAMLDEYRILTFHPNENTATVFIDSGDLQRFIKNTGHEYFIINA